MNHIAQLLFERHTHVNMLAHEPDLIVYTEDSVLEILKLLGHDLPVWDTPVSAREELDKMRKVQRVKHLEKSIEHFKKAIGEYDKGDYTNADIDPLLIQATRDGLQSKLSDLEAELRFELLEKPNTDAGEIL